MNVPDEAIEAAARASYPSWRAKAVSAGAEVPATFDDLPDQIKASFFDDIRPVLEAAAPHIAAQVLHEQATELRPVVDARLQESGVDVEGFDAEWLNVAEHIEARADSLTEVFAMATEDLHAIWHAIGVAQIEMQNTPAMDRLYERLTKRLSDDG